MLLLVGFSQLRVQGAYSGSPSSGVALAGTRDVPLTIKIVLIGFQPSDINTTYLTSIVNLPDRKTQAVLAGSQATGGVNFNFTYQTRFADTTTVTNLAAYLNSIQKTVPTPAGPPGTTNPPQNPYFNESLTDVGTVSNVFYDGSRVVNWLDSAQSFGPSPVPGYTLYVADLHSNVPSLSYAEYQAYFCKPTCTSGSVTAHVHYYNTSVTDPDLGLSQPRHYMTGWGGNNRSFLIDLSAGPSYWTDEPPIQVSQRIRGIGSSYLLNWRTQYIADYVAGAVYNLFAPDQLYPVDYSAKYVFHLFVFDARNLTEIGNGPAIASTVNLPMIKSQIAGLVPFANVTVIPKFATLASSPSLARVVNNATTTTFDGRANDTIVDARLVYNWLSTEKHISQFINASRTTDQIDIPEFIFAFSGNHEFGFTFKSDLFLDPRNSIFGVSLGDMVLISHNQKDLNAGNDYTGTGSPQPGKGIGFTRTIVHESGHQLGLVHPFMYDIDEDFVNSVMAYYPNELGYSRFDRDLELRGINDELLIFAQVTLAGTTSTLFNAGSISAARRAMTTADQKYSSMDYAGAVSYSLSAAKNAAAAQQGSGVFSALNAAGLYLVLGILVGAAVGLIIGFLVFRKRTPGGLAYYHCPTCNRPLRWDPAMTRWYCDYCQKPV